jgi:hypothetical protein
MEAAFMVTRKEEWGEREAPWRREEGGEERKNEKTIKQNVKKRERTPRPPTHTHTLHTHTHVNVPSHNRPL